MDNSVSRNFCTHCGNQLPQGAGFCGKCGNSVNGHIASPTVNSSYNTNINTYNMNNNRKNKAGKKVLIPIFILFAVVAAILYITVFSNSNGGNGKGRTIMLYMVGADLESTGGVGTEALDALNYQQLANNDTKVVAIVGGAKRWHNNYINSSSTSIYELTESGFKEVDNQSRKNMGATNTLSYFLNYVYDNYKTGKYDLVFWNHGAGIFGGEMDEIADDMLNLSEYKMAFDQSPFKGNNKIETVIFSTCLNGTIEVADTLKDYAKYMIASEEVTYSVPGNSEFKVFNAIKPDDSITKLGKDFIDGYMQTVKGSLGTRFQYHTYSLIDLEKINKLESLVNDFFSDIDLTVNYNQVAKIRSVAKQYGSADPRYDSVDLYNLISKLSYLSPTKADKALRLLDEVVKYNSASSEESKGLSIYFPYNGGSDFRPQVINNVYNFAGLSGYANFIRKFNNIQSGGVSRLNFSKNAVIANVDTDSRESDFTLELTEEQVERFAKAGYIVFKKVDNDYYKPLYTSTSVKLDGNLLKANVKDRQVRISDDGLQGDEILLAEKSENDDYIFYETNVILENLDDWEFDTAKMTLSLNKKNNEVKIDSVFIGGSNASDNERSLNIETPYNIVADLSKYTHISLGVGKYKILDENGNYKEDWEKHGELTGYEMKIEDLKFSFNNYGSYEDYYAVFLIRDTNNNLYYSKLIKMGE